MRKKLNMQWQRKNQEIYELSYKLEKKQISKTREALQIKYSQAIAAVKKKGSKLAIQYTK